MHNDFADAQTAAAFLMKGLVEEFPDAEAEVVASPVNGRRARHAVGVMRKAATKLRSYSRGFPTASVDYTPNNPYGFVALIQCVCPPDPSAATCPFHCENRSQCPRGSGNRPGNSPFAESSIFPAAHPTEVRR